MPGAQVAPPGPNGHPAAANGGGGADDAATKKFRDEVSELVINRLKTRYMPQGRIASKEDFKHLARKLTHIIVEKEHKRHNHSAPGLSDEVRKKAKRFIDDFFAKLDMPYHSEKTGPLQLPDPLQRQRDERKKAEKRGHHDAKDKKHKHKHKQHRHSHHHREHASGSEPRRAEAEAEPEAPPMSPVDDAPIASLAALPTGFVPMAISTDQNHAANGQ